jgi:anti-sigma factor RsiW
MSCKLEHQRPDWKAYALGELDAKTRRDAEAHASACADCQDELAQLRATLDTMSALREEEMPRRIAFVSDKIFEPNLWRRLSQALLRPSFAGALVVAAAILVHAFVRPAAPLPAPAPQVDVAAIEARVTAQVTSRVQAQMTESMNAAVARAVAETRKDDDIRAARLLAAAEKRYADAADFLNRQVTHIYALNSGAGVR